MKSYAKLPLCLLLCTIVCLIISGLHPFDRTTWILEIFPVLLAVPVLLLTYKKFPLTGMLYYLISIHALVLMLGGAYTYARVPLGFYIQDWLELSRNPYDKVGHFMQGFVPALVAREILIRQQVIKGRKMLAFVIICIVLAISATYELIEWAAAVALGQGADEFLGTQGDQWDTQSDMFLALLGALSAIIFLSRKHDKAINMRIVKQTS